MILVGEIRVIMRIGARDHLITDLVSILVIARQQAVLRSLVEALTRIEKNPERFASLSPDQQELAEQGKIEKGMHKDGVYIAMGKPDKVTQGANSRGDYEQWNYYRLQPIITHRIGGYWGSGYGGRFGGRHSSGYGGRFGGRYSSGYGGWGYSPTVTYIPRKSASVQFSGDYVDEYQYSGVSLYQ